MHRGSRSGPEDPRSGKEDLAAAEGGRRSRQYRGRVAQCGNRRRLAHPGVSFVAASGGFPFGMDAERAGGGCAVAAPLYSSAEPFAAVLSREAPACLPQCVLYGMPPEVTGFVRGAASI